MYVSTFLYLQYPKSKWLMTETRKPQKNTIKVAAPSNSNVLSGKLLESLQNTFFGTMRTGCSITTLNVVE